MHGRQERVFALECLLQFGDYFTLAVDDFVLGRKVVFDVYAELALGKVGNVPHRSLDHVVTAEVAAERFCFGRRFDDKKILSCHMRR